MGLNYKSAQWMVKQGQDGLCKYCMYSGDCNTAFSNDSNFIRVTPSSISALYICEKYEPK